MTLPHPDRVIKLCELTYLEEKRETGYSEGNEKILVWTGIICLLARPLSADPSCKLERGWRGRDSLTLEVSEDIGLSAINKEPNVGRTAGQRRIR